MANPLLKINHSSQKKLADLKVLVVDDQIEIRSMVKEVLSDAGVIQIFDACNGQEALNFISADFGIVNVIICDWNMPGMTGVEFLRQIRTIYPTMPFLMVTGRCDRDSVSEAISAGVTAFICKPFSPRQLEEKLRIVAQSKVD